MTKSVSGGKTVDNYYDGAGLRYGKKVNNGDMTVSLYEYSNFILEINGTSGAQNLCQTQSSQILRSYWAIMYLIGTKRI